VTTPWCSAATRARTCTRSAPRARSSSQWSAAARTSAKRRTSEIRLHDLRHTHATLLLAAGEPVKVVSERLGHATAMITLNVYQAVIPGMQRSAAERFASLVRGPEDDLQASIITAGITGRSGADFIALTCGIVCPRGERTKSQSILSTQFSLDVAGAR
jgi:hypothetical protein